MAILCWIKSKKMFLKIQEGTGDVLMEEDRAAGMVDYVLWSTFQPKALDLDEELEMNLVDGGILMDNKPMTPRGSVGACYSQAIEKPYNPDDVVKLMEE